MEECVVGAAIGATIQVLLQNLLTKSMQEINLIYGFKKDMAKLKDSLLIIQDYLSDAEAQKLHNKAVERWLQRLESLAFKADAVLDEINYHLLSQKVDNPSKEVKVSSISLVRRVKIAHKIKDINRELEITNKDAQSYGLHTAVVASHVFSLHSTDHGPSDRETDAFTIDPIVVGRENDVSKIVDMLVSAPVERVFSIIPIVGMGGLGKTTLARRVLNHEKINTHFDEKIWVCVSHTFNVVTLFKMILQSLTGESCCELSRQGVLKRIQQHLGDKRYLLVLDDVWSDEPDKWDDFLNSLSGITSARGHGIIVTTRKEKVASLVQTFPVYNLDHLTEDSCWSIIKAKAFKGADVPVEFEEIGKRIAQKCKGLPLAAKVVGGLLNGNSKEKWVSILKTQLSYYDRDENHILKILKLSFDHLPSASLKKCFAYCSVFPQDTLIRKHQLIQLWMAEGLLKTDEENNMEIRGDTFFNHLLQNSLFQDAGKDQLGNITVCKMHDLVHDLACSVSGLKENGSNDMHRARYLSLDSSRDGQFSISQEQAKYVRTLFCKCIVINPMFSKFKSLHVLKLVGGDAKDLPIQIGNLIHLRYLEISDRTIRCLPDSVGKLYNLQTLWILYVEKLPNTIVGLISLRHLYVRDTQLPPGIGKLTCLQTLLHYKVGHEKGCRIGELGSLKNLRGRLCIEDLENVGNKAEARSADLYGKGELFDLQLCWSKSINGANEESVFEGLQCPQNLKRLEIFGYKGRSFPLWTMKMAVYNSIQGHWMELNNLVDLHLSNCDQCEEIPTLGHLPHLKSLVLDGMSNVKSLDRRFYGIESCSSTSNNTIVNLHRIITPFPELERLELRAMPSLSEWVDAEAATTIFPCLEFLEIDRCPQLKSAPTHLACLDILSITEVKNCLPLTNICGGNLNSLKELKIINVLGLIYLPDGFFVKNQNLRYLSIWDCPNLTHLVPSSFAGGSSLQNLVIGNCHNLRELPNDLYTLQSLKQLYINKCTNLKSIPYKSSGELQRGLISLQNLKIGACPKLTTFPIEMLESCAEQLKNFGLTELPNLMNLSEIIALLPRMLQLRALTFGNGPRLVNGLVSGLRSLCIGPLSNSFDVASFNNMLHGIFQGFQSLRCLFLFGHEQWEILPDQLQNLTALEDLELHSFGSIESLPEWLGIFSSLRTLRILHCKKLVHLPSKEAIQRLIKLKHLTIISCPLLKERCRRQSIPSDNSEWYKISHIPDVYVW